MISFKRHRFPSDVFRYAVWLYFRFTLSIQDVEELRAQRGIDVSREAVRCWVNKFGPLIAANLRRRRLPRESKMPELLNRIQFEGVGLDQLGERLGFLDSVRSALHACNVRFPLYGAEKQTGRNPPNPEVAEIKIFAIKLRA